MKYITPLVFLLSGSVFATEFVITEETLQAKVKAQNPTLSEIESTFLASKINAEEMKDRFGYEFYTGASHANTKEKALISYQPVFSNVNQYQMGVKKYTKYGVVLDLNRSVDVRSADDNYTDLTTTTDKFGIQMDLWKDFMGAITKSNFENLQDLKKKDELQEEISKNVLSVNVRKLYWSIVANSQKIKITQNLHETAKKQAADARRRKAASVSDRAEVARFESLVHQRKGSLLALEYEREVLFKNLRDLFPDLNGKEFKLGDYNIDKTIFEVLSCSAQIDGQKQVPFEHTKYDEIVGLLKSVQGRQLKVDEKYDDIDLKLDLAFQRVGVASETDDDSNYSGSYSDSVEDLRDNDRSGFSAGISLTIPFGENKKGTTAVKEAYTEKQFDANISNLETNVLSTHKQVQKSIKLLNSLIKEQRSNSKQLAIRVKEMKKKYSQARIPEYALIQDEDSLLQSDLTIVDTQLMVVNTILDYFAVFNTYPCNFNRK